MDLHQEAVESSPKSAGDPGSVVVQDQIPSLMSDESDGNEKQQIDVLAASASGYPEGGLRAWVVVFGSFCLVTSSFGVVNSWGVFQTYYSVVLLPNSSPSAISWIGSVQYALTFLPAIVTGRLFDLGHFHVPLLIVSGCMVLFVFLTAECTQYWQFLLCQGFALGIASGFIFGPAVGVVAHWFKRRRSTAIGFIASGSSLGGAVFPILIRNLIPIVGFRWTMRIFGFVLLAILILANLACRRRLPPVNVSGGLFNFRVLKNPPFAAYVIACFFTFLGQYTVLTYINSSSLSFGIDDKLAFYLIAIANALSGLGRIFPGFAADRIGPLNIIMPLTALTAGMTYAWPYAHTSRSVIVVAVIYGFTSGAFASLVSIPAVNMGEISDVGRRVGILFTLMAFGAILGPPISGLIGTATHGYTAVGFYAGSMILLGVGFMYISKVLLLGRFFGGKV